MAVTLPLAPLGLGLSGQSWAAGADWRSEIFGLYSTGCHDHDGCTFMLAVCAPLAAALDRWLPSVQLSRIRLTLAVSSCLAAKEYRLSDVFWLPCATGHWTHGYQRGAGCNSIMAALLLLAAFALWLSALLWLPQCSLGCQLINGCTLLAVI